ncbi:hypothetical protein [Clostridium sp.]|uniref:hypothetical protein n=1 Tax=Clostridium TaxID=1485 RepID=UPI0028FE581D|nr:hypothetical protein [Clostridium sp.]MDU7260726.1 hypothetical protein [Clostridium butyricum]MDU1068178.1 hypothetical protein [Clostridium sp.]MDU2679752.1 hypothetical protein [Clostridium sp.]MDU4211933.1 hypothetical protein [Clostridium sp.]MDU5175092.1 hypothetical protein [Clostridium sp.]
MLTQRQTELMPKVVEMYLNKATVKEITKELKTSKDCYYAIINSDEFKGELGKVKDNNLRRLKYKMSNDSVKDYDSLRQIADNSEDEKLKTTIYMYLIDHSIGKPTTKLEQTLTDNSNNNKEVSIEDMLQDLEVDNVINLEDKKVK